MYGAKIRPVKSVQFRLLSSDEIRKKSVMECLSTDSYKESTPVPHGTMSLIMGADQNHDCGTCGQSIKYCPGHPGRIELAKPCFNALMFDTVVKVLRCVCFRCSRLLYHPAHPDMVPVMRLHGQRRFEALMKLMSKSSVVKSRCGNANPHGCGALQPTRITKQFVNDRFMRISMDLTFDGVEGGSTKGDDDKTTETISMGAEDILMIFKRIQDDDIAAMGFHPKLSRPESMIIEVLLVPPPAIRPSHQSALLQRSDSDLTNVISSIIKANNQVANRIRAGKVIEPNDLYVGLLQYHVATLMDNEMTGLTPATQRTGRSIVSISQRLKTKEGRVRGNLLGKRVDSSARCVITPDPYIALDEFGVPLKVATNITFPETVTSRNIGRLQDMVNNGPTNFPGARFVELVKFGRTVSLSPDRKPVIIEVGDIVQRHMMDGDYVLFNRQPTLHKMSMMAHRVKVMDQNTFRLNPSVTTPYNADFDGDELNGHAAISAFTMLEIASLAAVPVQMISPRTSKPIIGIVQDVAVGVYELTNPKTVIDKYLFANLMAPLPMFSGETMNKLSSDTRTGQTALSSVIPPLVNIVKKNSSYNDDDPSDPLNKQNMIRISHGHVFGVMDKDAFGSATSGLIHHVYNEIGSKATVDMLDATQRLICDWFKHRGFSVGLSDLVISDEAKQAVTDVIHSTKKDVYSVIADVHSGRFNNSGLGTPNEAFEKKMRELLNKARDEAQKIGKKHIGPNNRMMSMIKSKSKGNDINVVQMIATLGQQIADGKRPSYGFDGRTLPHYYKYDDGPEARGFVENSFVSGLSPTEFFFHSTGGREGLMDTAVKSVTYETYIIIVKNGFVKRTMIGKWIDEELSSSRDLVQTFPNDRNLEMLKFGISSTVVISTMDYDGNVSWAPITAVTRHDPGEVLYRITTEHGRSVTVTAGKSLLVWKSELNSFKEVESDTIVVGDHVPLTANLGLYPIDFGTSLEYTRENGMMVGMAICEEDSGPIFPAVIFAPEPFVIGVLEYCMGSKRATIANNRIYYTGTEEKLEFVSNLFTRIGVVTTVAKDSLYIQGDDARKAIDILNLRKYGFHDLDREVRRNDVVMDKIVSIEKVVPHANQKMYDLTVPSTLNFGLANGLQVRDTSESGYIQRKLIKAMEDCKIATDHTVRNAAGHIIQFQYGEDGMDSTTIESHKLFHISYDTEKTISEFLVTTSDPLETYLNSTVLKQFLSEVDWKEFDDHVRDIISERRELIVTTFGNKMEKNINYPVAFERIINNAIQRQYLEFPKGTPSDLSPIYSLRKLNSTIPTLTITSALGPCLFIRVLMRTFLAPKQILKLGIMKHTLDEIYETVVERFFESIAHPGEMVGIIAAQSIGEPTTQLTLNTFHQSGIESASRATMGLPRVKELLSVSKNPKQVILTASIVPGFRETIDDANRVKNELETTYLSQLVSKSSVYFDTDKFSTNIEEDKDLVANYRYFDKADASRNVSNEVSPWVIRLEMSKPDMLEHGVTMFDIAEAVNDFYKDTVCCMYSDDNSDQLIFRVRLTSISSSATSTDMLTDIRAFELSMLESVIIKGGFGVSKAIPLKKHGVNDTCYDESIGEFVKCSSNSEEWLLETDGKDLGEIMAHPLVVSSLTITNDINEVWKTLGIEAARAALLYELGEVMREAYANPRHFYMLVDVMCEKGVLTSIDRHGLNRGDTTGPLTKASFEETIDIIRNAGMFAEVDNVNSVAANIMLGQVVKAGTGGAVIHLDETLIGGLPEYFDKAQTSVDVVSTVSDEDLCRTIMRFMYTEPSSSLDIIPKINVPVITYVK